LTRIRFSIPFSPIALSLIREKDRPLGGDLYDSISKKIAGKGFATVADFVNYVLRVAVGKETEELDAEDTESVMARLKALGYI
jgi:hypothetical protein